ncbi:MAG: hypothetical protein M3O70_16595 [Actinomycetota bacterium]|nr:hypothetical protein [Actinomycetota bacterium]
MNDEALASFRPAGESGSGPHGQEWYVLELKLTREQGAALERVLEPVSNARLLCVPVSTAEDLASVLVVGAPAVRGRGQWPPKQERAQSSLPSARRSPC